MENVHRFMSSLPLTSERFDKQALLQLHGFARQVMRDVPEATIQLPSSFTNPTGSSGAASPVPLESLNPISLNQLQVGQVHSGQVLYGTLCAEPFSIGAIMTLLEDDNGLAVTLAIYNAAQSQTNIDGLYPRGAKVAIRDPCFMCDADGSLAICVDNPANVEMLETQKEKRAESLTHADVEEVRKIGNSCFREKQWNAAAEHYTKCIDAALLQLKKGSSSDNNNINTCLLHAYSNRAETRLQVKEFELALEDSDKALGISSGNLKALYRKGRALVGLRQYAAACKCLEKGNKASPGHKEIQDALRQAKTLYAQSLNGKYDISNFLLGFVPPPEVADFMGSVEIKMTEDGRGRGIYATREISTGQLILVSNAVAIAYEDRRRASSAGINVDHQGNISPSSLQDLIATVVNAARKSQILLQQLYSLDGYYQPRRLDVPAIEMFKTEGQKSLSQAGRKEKLQVDVNRIRAIISRNGFGGAEKTFASKSKKYEAKLAAPRGQSFSGLWLLPSFINHSCLPNSKRLEVGSAMFIHASKPIKRGEEITISYFDALVPLKQRQAMCENWDFKCKCRRCILEFSLTAALKPLTARFEQLHDKAVEETIAARSQKRFNADLPACAEFAQLFAEAEEIIRNSALLKAKEEKSWIRASFVSTYFAGIESNYYFPTTLTDCSRSWKEVMEAIQNTVPGDIRALIMVGEQLKEATRWMRKENQEFIIRDESLALITRYASDQAREVCIGVFGRHSEDALKALALEHANSHFF